MKDTRERKPASQRVIPRRYMDNRLDNIERDVNTLTQLFKDKGVSSNVQETTDDMVNVVMDTEGTVDISDDQVDIIASKVSQYIADNLNNTLKDLKENGNPSNELKIF